MTLTGLLREISRAVTAGGLLWVCVPPVDERPAATATEADTPPRPAPRSTSRPTVLTGPPPGHPERLRPDVPLNAVERLLQRQLDDHRGEDPTGR